MLTATLPSADKTGLVERMFSHPAIGGARYNVGIRTVYDPVMALSLVKTQAEKYNKKLWIDLKGRQLRITRWAEPTYGDIELNHEIEVDLPARIFFRGGHCSNVIGVNGNRISVDPDPTEAVGAGQAVNIIGSNLQIRGYLTEQDVEYLEAAKRLGIRDCIISFVEQPEDIIEVKQIFPEARPVLKIESQKGLAYLATEYHGEHQLMAARDDLLVNIGENKAQVLKTLEMIIEKDPEAIAASHILGSLETLGHVMVADLSDLRLLQLMGYKHFMLSDNISHRHFDQAMAELMNYFRVYNE